MIDIHSHILPGLDDGASSLEESIEMCRIAIEDGIKAIVATPHVLKGAYSNENPITILEKIEQLKINAPDGIEILPGSDLHFQHDIIHRVIEQKSIITINNKSYLLIEFPFNGIPIGTNKTFHELLSHGITPIITHPERNLEFIQNPKLLYELVKEGALAQVTAMSITGEFGNVSKDAAHFYLTHNLVHIIASDAHDAEWRTPRLKDAVEVAAKKIEPEKAKAMVEDNPKAILGGEPLPFLEKPVSP